MEYDEGEREGVREGDREQDGSIDYASNLTELGNASLVDSDLSDGTKSGYVFSLAGTQFAWSMTADAPVHLRR